jgi:hypothetical protein
MKTKNNLYRLLLLLLISCACKKGMNETRVDGVVINKKTGLPFEKCSVVLWKENSGIGSNNGLIQVSGTKTNSKGEYQFTFRNNNDSYLVEAVGDVFAETRFYQAKPMGNIKKSKTNSINIELVPKALVKLNISAFLPFKGNDYFDCNIYNGVVSTKEYDTRIIRIDDDYIIPAEGEANNKIVYTYTVNGISNTKDTTIFLKSFETKTINIKP